MTKNVKYHNETMKKLNILRMNSLIILVGCPSIRKSILNQDSFFLL